MTNDAEPIKDTGAREIPVRLSHLLQHCSVGAIIRDGDELMVVPDVLQWGEPGEQLRYVDQVRDALGIEKDLRKPPFARQLPDDGRWTACIPVRRFPLWARCSKCDLLHWAPWRKSDELRCTRDICDGALEQVPWVLIHERGYLADVPWHAVAHAGRRNPRQQGCEWRNDEVYLRIEQRDGRRMVQCSRCGASNELPKRWIYPKTAWQQPWLPGPLPSELQEPALLLEVNNVLVHSTVTPTALVIPPESRIRRGSVVDRLFGNTERQDRIQRARNDHLRMVEIRRAATEYRCSVESVDEALKEIARGYPSFGRSREKNELKSGEYRALCQPIPDLKEEEDFVTAHYATEWAQLRGSLPPGSLEAQVAAMIDRLVSVRKLKEIMVLKGFRRASYNTEYLTPPDINGRSDWLPAIELYGEGVFFTLDEKWLRHWEQEAAVCERAREFQQRHHQQRALNGAGSEVSPRFLLCHTLAHLLIRRLEAEAGYPAASLKERIYSASEKAPMAGVLIYVAVADEQGSLGGLMEQATPAKFLRLLVAACESAQWCSLDPVCLHQAGHGPYQLNRAACHACTLVPETSCSHGNVLLDRTFLRGENKALPTVWSYAEAGG